MSLFDKKGKQPTGADLRKIFKRAPSSFGGVKRHGPKERMKMADEIFPKKYGSRFSPKDKSRALYALRKSKTGKSYGERAKIQKKIDYLNRVMGK